MKRVQNKTSLLKMFIYFNRYTYIRIHTIRKVWIIRKKITRDNSMIDCTREIGGSKIRRKIGGLKEKERE